MTTTRIATAAAAGCLYAAAIALLVGAEGRSYRDSLRRARTAAAAAAPAPDAATRVAAAPAPPAPAPAPAPAPPVETVARNAPPPAAPAAPPPETLAANVGAAPSIPAPAPRPAPAPTRAPAPAARSPGAIWADSLDLTRLTLPEEARLGAELNTLVLAANLVDRDGDIRRLRRAAAPLLERVERKGVQYRFAVLDSDEINAFSLPGGYVYVARGLFRLAGSEDTEPEDDYVLRFVLGHEIAHVDLKHALKLVAPNNAAGKKKGVDTLNQLMIPLALGYTDAQEFEADAWAYHRMTTALGHSTREGLMFLIKFQGLSEREGFRNGRAMPDPKSGRTLLDNHFRAHPAAWDRLDRLKARAEQASAPRR